LTNIRETHASDAAYAEVRAHYSEEAIVDLSMAIVAINSWNRLSIGLRAVPGTYQPGAVQTA
jgi:alkylhydroperoxidase family enzyme